DADYQELNRDANLIKEVRKAIDTTFSINVTVADFKITNDHDKSSDHQTPGEMIEFTVMANENSQLITNRFTFKITLLSKEISY
ncbi:spiralin repeat-containing protein, partial [Spiroplasma endosymbiont of Megaselia nigra]|uniref:spiralin repeat-containing protein n=1 Tax=Spiroplasma endosymbiont of Megaselia nigra TaxID=2478537 RepID=UPI000FABB740